MKSIKMIVCVLIAVSSLWPCLVQASQPQDPSLTPPAILRLEIKAPRTELAPGEGVQLALEGELADGSRRDITSDLGTHFYSDSEEIISVSPTGLVQALRRGDATLTAIHNQGGGISVTSSLIFRVRLPGDRDGDGLPDDYEAQHRLDPDFAGDGELDPDEDGLSNFAEREAGTDPRRADTDGDFRPDGLEIALGTDPLVPERPVEGELPLLDDNCVVSALNRSARVEPNGAWVLPNVPANTGRVRVRATCVKDGVTRSGQSDFFTLPANGTIRVAEIAFDEPAPIPAELVLAAPQTVLTAAGQTVQLTATGRLPDGSTRDLSAAASGTGYISSNPAIASVTADGLVTARVSGTVVVSALHEGALGVLRLQVALSGDSDGDGLPDDFELANGLDPNNPVDVLDDPDADGLSTRDEFQAGLDPFDADSDDDRLPDGREAEAGTDPLRADTDGDRVSDGLEVQAGSDPLDPNSVNLGPILASLSVSPRAFTLIFNTAVGETSRRLIVTGRLIDGTELDIRSRRYGTVYSSTDLSVANFGSEDGRVFAGQSGTATVTVANGSATATVQVTVETFAPTALAFLSIPGFANGVDVSGDYAYVAAGGAGLYVVDVSDLDRPAIVGFVDTPGNANDVRVSGSFAYVADGPDGLQIVDVSDPARPRIAGGVGTPGTATDLVVRGDLVYVADGAAGLQVIQAADRAAPVLLGGVDTPGEASGIDESDGLVVVADGSRGIQIVDASDPAAPALMGSTHTRPNAFSRAADVVVRGRLAYVADGRGSLGGLRVIDFSVPTTPVVVGSTADQFGLAGVALDGGFALAADYFYPNAVPIFNVGAAPVFSALLDFFQPPSFRIGNGNGIAVRDGVVFLAASRWEITDNGDWGDTGLHIGRWRVVGDELGAAPQVSITSPAAGAAVRERRPLTVQAEATDDVQVASVEFLMDGVAAFQDFRAPFEATLTVPAAGASPRLGARAVDFGGNAATAEEVVVTVVADDDPAVVLLAPVTGSRIVEGAITSIAATASDDERVAAVELFVDGVSRRVATAPPYRLDYLVPVGATQIIIEAVARDDIGQTASTGPHSFPVEDDPPPVVIIAEPAGGTQVVQGATLRVIAAATDDLGIAGVRALANGQAGPEDVTEPYELTVTVPTGASELRLAAEARDTAGQRSASPEVVLTVVPDPLTTATGSVVFADEQPAPGARVVCMGVSGTAGAGGAFSIAGVPTVAAEISCSASFTNPQGKTFSGSSAGVPPAPGEVTHVGPVVLTESLFETDLGFSLNLPDDQALRVTLPFELPLFGTSYTEAFINTNGNLSFVTASPRDWTEDRDEFVSGFRDRDGITVGPTIAVFWDDLEPQAELTGELDFFGFDGAAGDVVTVEILAARAGSRLDSVLTLFDAAGHVVAFNDDAIGLDSRIVKALPAAGRYFLRVEDYSGRGGPSYTYRLSLDAKGAPRTEAGREVEPNDSIELASPLRYGDAVSGMVGVLPSPDTRNIFVNDRVPGRYVLTWRNVPEYPGTGSNTVQLILFADGRIQLGYDGVTADDAIVGISPSTGGESIAVDFSADAPFSTAGPKAIFEEFDGPVGPDGTGEDPPGDRPFDLDGRVLVFSPNANSGFDVHLFGAGQPPPPPPAAAMDRTMARAASAVSGVVEGVVVPRGGAPVNGVEVVITSSSDPAYEARVRTDVRGEFRLVDVPAGGVNATVYEGETPRSHAAGMLLEPGEVLRLELRPVTIKAKP